MSAVPRSKAGMGAATNDTTRELGGALGVAVLGSIIASQFTSNLGPAVATILTRQTVAIRSTQSATGILYIGMTLVLFGELAGLILGRSAGIEL